MQDYRSKTNTGGYYSSSQPLPYGAGAGGSGTPQWMGNSQSMAERLIMSQPFRPSWQYPTSGVPKVSGPLKAPSNYGPNWVPYWGIAKDVLKDLEMLGDPWSEIGPSSIQTPAGWTLCATPSCGGEADYFVWNNSASCSTFGSCPPGQAQTSIGPTANLLSSYFVHATHRQIILSKHTSGTIGTPSGRYTLKYQFIRPAGSQLSPVVKATLPSLFLPPESVPDPHPLPEVHIHEGPGPQGSLPPYSVPSDDIVITPGGDPPVTIYPGTHDKVPDNTPKFKLDAGFVGALYGAVTEIDDFIEAWAKAIPGNPCKRLPLHKQIACVMAHLDEVNVKQALFNMIVNELQDRAIGKAGTLADRLTANPNWIRPYGTTAGSWAAPQTPSEFAEQAPQWQQAVDDWVDGLMQ